MTRKQSKSNFAASHQRTLHDVENYGWHVIKVCGGFPEWAYSIGLFQTLGHPEVIIFGLPPDLMHGIINDIGTSIRKNGPIRIAKRIDSHLDGFDVAFRTVHPKWYQPLVGQALSFYGSTEFSMIQCLWPDKHNHLPWDTDFDHRLNCRQPLLYEEDPESAHMQSILRDIDANKGFR